MSRLKIGENDLAHMYPQIASEWHPTKNEKSPEDYTSGSGVKVWWMCPKGHEYKSCIRERAKGGTGCPYCSAARQTSFAEQAFFFYIKKIYPDAKNKFKDIFTNTMELDIFIPSIHVGIEFDGAAWHKTEEQHIRERKKYEVCQQNKIYLIRVKERNGTDWRDVADVTYYISKKKKESKELSDAIQAILNSLDKSSNMWTRRNPFHVYSNIRVNLERDRSEILSYLNDVDNSLENLRPDVLDKWDYAKNGALKPSMFSVSSNQIVWWKCPDCGHEWQSSINGMTRKGRFGCAECSKVHRSKSFTKYAVSRTGALSETHPSIAEEWHYEKNGDITPSMITACSNKKIWWICKNCGYSWLTSPNNRQKGSGCPCCSGRVPKTGENDFATLYPQLLKEWDYTQNTTVDPHAILPRSGKNVWWICSACGHHWSTVVRNRANGSGCPICAKRKRSSKVQCDDQLSFF